MTVKREIKIDALSLTWFFGIVNIVLGLLRMWIDAGTDKGISAYAIQIAILSVMLCFLVPSDLTGFVAPVGFLRMASNGAAMMIYGIVLLAVLMFHSKRAERTSTKALVIASLLVLVGTVVSGIAVLRAPAAGSDYVVIAIVMLPRLGWLIGLGFYTWRAVSGETKQTKATAA